MSIVAGLTAATFYKYSYSSLAFSFLVCDPHTAVIKGEAGSIINMCFSEGGKKNKNKQTGGGKKVGISVNHT